MGKKMCCALGVPCLARYLSSVCFVSFILHESRQRKPYFFLIIAVDLCCGGCLLGAKLSMEAQVCFPVFLISWSPSPSVEHEGLTALVDSLVPLLIHQSELVHLMGLRLTWGTHVLFLREPIQHLLF